MDSILFLHGWGASSATWGGVRKFFESVAQCIWVDFDCDPEKVMTLDDYVEYVEGVLIERRVTTCCVVAHSFGARVAVLLAKRNPHMVTRMVITGGAGLKPRGSVKRWARVRAYKWFGIGKGSADYRRLSRTGKATFVNIIKRNLAGEIARLRVATLLIYGKRDRDTPLYMGKRWTKLQKGSILKVYDGAGHFAFLDAPGEFVLDAYKFLRGQ